MSTSVDEAVVRPSRRTRSSAAATRARVLDQARIAFCHTGFDHLGLREIAGLAGTDAAIIVRLFGSKENLFREVAAGAFDFAAALDVPIPRMGAVVASMLLDEDEEPETDLFDPVRFLLLSAASPTAAPIASACLHTDFILPLARRLGMRDPDGRATLITACIVGLAAMRFALQAPALDAAGRRALHAPFAAAIQACIETDAPPPSIPEAGEPSA